MNIKNPIIAAVALIFASTTIANAQNSNGWHLKDKKKDGYNGISLAQAYDFLKSKKLKSKTVIVGVIDSGIDTTHEDLKSILWVNKKEIPGNGIDDDGNGYIDDVHGWNFLGGKDPQSNVDKDSYEAARVYYALKPKWEGKTAAGLSGNDLIEFNTFQRAEKAITGDIDQMQIAQLRMMMPVLLKGDSALQKEMGKTVYNAKDLKDFKPSSKEAITARQIFISLSDANKSDEITNEDFIKSFQGEIDKADAAKNPPPNYRGDVVKDNYSDLNDRYYGNYNLLGGSPFHGTHVAGIIAAVRNNGIGMDGVADNVRIMAIRAVPDGDEHDKDIALAIRYAVDNGAQIINMSFGKDFSPEKDWVDDAIRYAQSKGVLLVHAAGNSAKNIDTTYNYPNVVFAHNKGRATNVITVGASGDPKLGGDIANFSNYGPDQVDVFAPGVRIYSTIPGGNKYGNAQGTSMAAPVVVGVAALIKEYYPNLTPEQIKESIEKSVIKPKGKVTNPETGELVDMKTLSKTGGFVNALGAVKYADNLSKKNEVKFKLPKSTIKTKAKN